MKSVRRADVNQHDVRTLGFGVVEGFDGRARLADIGVSSAAKDARSKPGDIEKSPRRSPSTGDSHERGFRRAECSMSRRPRSTRRWRLFRAGGTAAASRDLFRHEVLPRHIGMRVHVPQESLHRLTCVERPQITHLPAPMLSSVADNKSLLCRRYY